MIVEVEPRKLDIIRQCGPQWSGELDGRRLEMDRIRATGKRPEEVVDDWLDHYGKNIPLD